MLILLKCSVAGAIANGLCYYAFYDRHPTVNTVVAAAIADVTWCVSKPFPYPEITPGLQALSRYKKLDSHSTAT
jgi:hypothetical protein